MQILIPCTPANNKMQIEIDRIIKNNVNICCTIFRRYNRLENGYVCRSERDDTFLYKPPANNVQPKDKKILQAF